MSDELAPKSEHNQPDTQSIYRMRLPGFLVETEIGLGDVIKRATSAMGIKPCGSCEQRAAALNRWMMFSGRR